MSESTHFPSIPWVHNPGEYGTWSSYPQGGMEVGEFAGGWVCLLALGDADRCNVVHQVDPTAQWGSCAGYPYHEHPHVWGQHGWHLMSICREKEMANAVVGLVGSSSTSHT